MNNYYYLNREKCLAASKKYREDNIEKIKIIQAAYYKKYSKVRRYRKENSHKLFRDYIRLLLEEYERETKTDQ